MGQLQAELRLFNAYLLVKSLAVGPDHVDEVLFCQRVRKQLTKTKPCTKVKKSLEQEEDFGGLINAVLVQATAMCKEWPRGA